MTDTVNIVRPLLIVQRVAVSAFTVRAVTGCKNHHAIGIGEIGCTVIAAPVVRIQRIHGGFRRRNKSDFQRGKLFSEERTFCHGEGFVHVVDHDTFQRFTLCKGILTDLEGGVRDFCSFQRGTALKPESQITDGQRVHIVEPHFCDRTAERRPGLIACRLENVAVTAAGDNQATGGSIELPCNSTVSDVTGVRIGVCLLSFLDYSFFRLSGFRLLGSCSFNGRFCLLRCFGFRGNRGFCRSFRLNRYFRLSGGFGDCLGAILNSHRFNDCRCLTRLCVNIGFCRKCRHGKCRENEHQRKQHRQKSFRLCSCHLSPSLFNPR